MSKTKLYRQLRCEICDYTSRVYRSVGSAVRAWERHRNSYRHHTNTGMRWL